MEEQYISFVTTLARNRVSRFYSLDCGVDAFNLAKNIFVFICASVNKKYIIA
jgi:hypothetical protein